MTVTAQQIDKAVAVLRRGGLVAFPTETVYGLGADAANPAAVRRIFEAKGRPANHPLIVHLADAAQLDEWAVDLPESARRLAAACWPGALTMVVRKAPWVPLETTGGLDTIGLRVPAQPLAHALLHSFGGGIAAPSANRFGRVSPTRAADVAQELGDRVDLILDGGPCSVGLESTIVDMCASPIQVLRPGGVAAEDIEEILQAPVERQAVGPARAPGMLEAHYAPLARVIAVEDARAAADVARLGRHVGLIALSDVPVAFPSERLAAPSTVEAYAHDLYAALREGDARRVDLIIAILPPPRGIGTAVRDRLARAARGTEVGE